MTEPNNQSRTDNQNEKIIDSLRYEIASLKSQLKKRDDRISSLDVMLNQIVESHNAEVRADHDQVIETGDLTKVPKSFSEDWEDNEGERIFFAEENLIPISVN